MNLPESIGRYFIFLGQSVRTPERHRVYYRQTMRELVDLGVNSIIIVIVISLFMGAAIALQTAYNTDNPIYPRYVIGLGVRDSMILEFSSTMVALILAGKVGSHIASQIGTMRITEQIKHGVLPCHAQNCCFSTVFSLPHTYKHSCRYFWRLAGCHKHGNSTIRRFHLRHTI